MMNKFLSPGPTQEERERSSQKGRGRGDLVRRVVRLYGTKRENQRVW